MYDSKLPATNTPEQTRKRYEQLVYGVFAVAIVGLLAGLAFGYQLAGATIYLVGVWLGVGLTFLLPKLSDVTFYDERDEDLHRRASGLTMSVLFIVALGVVPAVYVLDAAGYVTITPTMWGSIWTASALFLLWGLCYGITARGH